MPNDPTIQDASVALKRIRDDVKLALAAASLLPGGLRQKFQARASEIDALACRCLASLQQSPRGPNIPKSVLRRMVTRQTGRAV